MTSVEETTPAVPARPERWLARPLVQVGLGAGLLLLIVLAAAAYAGYQAGLTQRESQWRATQSTLVQTQYEHALDDLQGGRYELAIERFEYVLQLDPTFRDAAQKLAEARQAVRVTATPAHADTATPSPTAQVSPEAAQTFALAQEHFAAGDWDATIEALAGLHAIDSEYEAVKADGMLYVALRNRGIARILGDEMEGGLFDLGQAEAFGPLDAEALNYRTWARYYLAAQSYWGVNWGQSLVILRELYLIAPYFRDTAQRLFHAALNYAEQMEAAGDYCQAANLYAEALTLLRDPEVEAAQAAAQAACAQTPTPDLTAGTPAEGTESTPSPDLTETPSP